MIHLPEGISHIRDYGRNRIPLQDRFRHLDTLGIGFQQIIGPHEPDLVEEIVRGDRGQHQIGPSRTFIVPVLEMAVRQFREHALVQGARLQQIGQQFNGIVDPIDVFQAAGLGQHGVPVGGLSAQGNANNQPD